MKKFCIVAAIAVFTAAPVLAQAPWVHVEVDEGGDDDAHVRVNLPLTVVQLAIEAAPEKIIEDGEIHLHHVDEDLDVEDLRKIWSELRETGDAEFVTIEKKDGSVRVRREGDFIRINVDDRKEHEQEQVHVEVPVSVVDALFSGEGETLNLEKAISQLSTQRGDIVRVDDGKTKIRVWIDEGN